MANELYIGNDNIVRISGIKNPSTGLYITTATVTGRVVDLDGVDVSNHSWPITLSYVGPNGVYEGVVESTASLQEGNYIFIWDASDSGLVGHGEKIIPAEIRR